MKNNVYLIAKGENFSRGKKPQETIYFLSSYLLFCIISIFGAWIVGLIGIGITFLIHKLYNKKTKEGFSKKVIFDTSCVYQIDGPDKYDINKLFGLYEGFDRKNSIRFGWRYLGGVIEIFSYCYTNGDVKFKKITECYPKEELTMSMKINQDSYELEVLKNISGEMIKMVVKKIKNENKFDWLIFKGYPFFGGNTSAPHDMKINIF